MATNPFGGLIFTLVTSVPPVTAKSVLVSVPWFEVQKGLPVGLRDIPQGFTNKGSVILARPGMFETRLV